MEELARRCRAGAEGALQGRQSLEVRELAGKVGAAAPVEPGAVGARKELGIGIQACGGGGFGLEKYLARDRTTWTTREADVGNELECLGLLMSGLLPTL